MKISEIIVASDLSEASSSAARWASEVSNAFKIPLHYVHVVETGRGLFASSLNSALSRPEKIEEIRAEVAEWADAATGQAAHNITVKVGKASSALREFVLKHDGAWLVLGQATHSGVARIALGSLTYKMAQQPVCTTVIVQQDHHSPTASSLVVGTDFTPYSRRAVYAAAAFGAAMSCGVHVVHANPSPPVTVFEGTNIDVASLKAEAFARAEAQMTDLIEELSEHYPEARLSSEVSSRYPAEALMVAVEDRNAQQLFLGYSHESPLMQVMLGSTSLRCLNQMKSNLILVP